MAWYCTHNPAESNIKTCGFYPAYLPDPKDEIEADPIYGEPTVALMINTHEDVAAGCPRLCGPLPANAGHTHLLPLEDGVDALIPIFKDMIDKSIAWCSRFKHLTDRNENQIYPCLDR